MTPLAAQTMARYIRWINGLLYEHCARLSDEERRRDVGAFFKPIHGRLNHLLLGDRVWLGGFTGAPFAVTSLALELYADFDELRAERASTDAFITEWTGALTPEALQGQLSYRSIVNPEPRRYPLWLAVTHFFNHQTHHRGQVTKLLFQRGIDPSFTDLIWLAELQ